MLVIKDRPITTAAQAKSILDRHTAQYGLIIDLDKCLDYVSYGVEKNRQLNNEWWEMAGTTSLVHTKVKDVRAVLKNRFDVPDELLRHRGKEGLNKTIIAKVLDSDYVSEGAKEFLKLYKKIDNNGYIMSYLQQYLNAPLLKGESFEGHRMVLAKPEWNILATGRLSAKKPSLQNLTKSIGDIITYPKGTLLVRADSGQIEPRITYSHYIVDPLLKALILEYNDAYYAMARFITLTPEEELILRFRDNLLYESYETVYRGKVVNITTGCPVPLKSRDELPLRVALSEEDRKKIKLYLLAGNYGGNLKAKFPGDELAVQFHKRIVSHPLRLKLQDEVDKSVDNGQEKFYTAFGTEIVPEATLEYNKNEDLESWLGHLKRCGFNNPIQGTASDLMCESVYYADKIITSKSKYDTFIMYYKHDEGAFIVDERDAHIIPELQGVTAYQVRDWIPIYSDVEMGIVGGTPEWSDLRAII